MEGLHVWPAHHFCSLSPWHYFLSDHLRNWFFQSLHWNFHNQRRSWFGRVPDFDDHCHHRNFVQSHRFLSCQNDLRRSSAGIFDWHSQKLHYQQFVLHRFGICWDKHRPPHTKQRQRRTFNRIVHCIPAQTFYFIRQFKDVRNNLHKQLQEGAVL